jgi:hypothetical protein
VTPADVVSIRDPREPVREDRNMRFAVESWAPDFGAQSEGAGMDASDAQVDIAVEVAPDKWGPLDPADRGAERAGSVLFVDGVQRIDARVWVTGDDEVARLGVCASWAAGAVMCNGSAQVVAAEVRRGVLCPSPDLDAIVTRHGGYEPLAIKETGAAAVQMALGQRRGDLEARVAVEVSGATPADLVVVDGPLGDRRHIPCALGYIKAHHVTYLPPAQQAVLGLLGPGQRTPLFRIGERRFRWSWYLRLPGPMTHAIWGIVRCELAGELSLAEAVALADKATLTLPRFATRPHQDSRAPQNLHPIAGLERELKHRLGDAGLMERALRRAAVGAK